MTYKPDRLTDGRRSPDRRCIVAGCAAQVPRGTLICPVHAQALRPVPPAEFCDPPKDAA